MKYLILTDKLNIVKLVFLNEKENDYIVFEFKKAKYEFKYISLVPYYLDDTDLYEQYEELNEEEFYLELAKQLAKAYHKGQVDKAGVDYFTGHISTVVNGVETNEEKIVAYLHDIIEDTKLTQEDLLHLGFSEKVVNAVVALTKDKKVKYEDYLKNVKNNKLAKVVKLSDLSNNMDLSRLKEITEVDEKRLQKYKKAFEYLSEQD